MTEPSLIKKRKPWWYKLLGNPAVVILIILLLSALAMDAVGRHRLNQAIADARALGQPVTFEEILAQRKVWPPDQDAGRYFQGIRPHLVEVSKQDNLKQLPMVGDGDLPPLGQLWSSEHSQAISTQLASLSLEIAQIDRLKDFPGGSLPLVVTENPWVTMLPELADLRFSAKLKCLDILNKAIKGDTASLVEDVTVLSRLGQLLTDHPVLITSLVKIACDSLSIQVIEEVNALTTLSPEQLTSISDQLAIVEAEDPIRWGLLGERALQIKAFQWALKRNRTDRREIPIFPGVIGFQGWHMCDMAAGIRIENKLMLSVNEPRKRLDKAKQLENEFEALPKYYLFTNILCFILVRALELSLRTTAQIRAARVGLAIEHYRIDKGNFPERLEQLMPDYMQVLPQDPFDDQPLHYKLTTDAAIVYSIGEDGVDNGGDVRRENCGSQPADVGFTVLKPERRRLSAQKSDTATQTAPASSASGR